MKPLLASGLLAASSLISLVSADGSGTLGLKISKNRQVERAQLAKRGTVQTTLGNAEQMGLYYANVTIGTPGQSFGLQLDTGSSDVWVPSSDASICTVTQDNPNGCFAGSFISSQSKTFVDVEKGGFNISYVDGSGSTGDYFQDTFSMSGATLRNFEMGLATDTSIPYGLIGIAYAVGEANVFTGNGSVYPNLVDALVNQGIIPSQAYSLWLDDLGASTGQILFGGIDTSKYLGTLSSLEIYPDMQSGSPVFDTFTVAFTSLAFSNSAQALTPSNYAVAAILDSGTSLTLLPDDLANAIFQELGASESRQIGITVPCDLAQESGTLNFGFGGSGGPVIKVPISELVLPLVDGNGNAPHYSNGKTACQLGIEPAQGRPVLFGDTFLRSAYVVYDLVNNRIGIAQTNFNAGSSNIVQFASQGAPIPSATAAQSGISVTQTATGNPRGPVGFTASGTLQPTAAGSAAATLTGGGSATGAGASPSKGAARPGLEPFAWESIIIFGMSLCMMLVGGGVFTLL